MEILPKKEMKDSGKAGASDQCLTPAYLQQTHQANNYDHIGGKRSHRFCEYEI